MNHTYRLVWNQEAQRYVPAPECAKGKSKSTAKALAPAAVLLAAAFALPTWAAPPAANALPTGGQVVSGNASIGQSGNAMTVNQGSQKAIIDWTSFDIGKNASVTFLQNNSSSIALNRVTAGDASQIHGQLNANGQVWLINPNGVVFGQGSRIDVGGLVASTMNITNADFENGNYTFTRGNATGSISNQGQITAKDGGSITLLAPTVSNDGVIRAQLGTVAMAAGDKITLQAGANGLLNVEIDPATVRTLIENKQLIVADGGQVIMTGKAADQLSASVVANTGTIQANTLQERDGKILLLADMQHGETQAAGQLEAKFVDTSAATVHIDKDLKVNTNGGEWLVDPVNITIDTNKATAIQNALNTGNVTVSTANDAANPWGTNGTGSDKGDITVNAAITWNNATELTLHADNNIAINASITAKNADGKLALRYGQGSSDGMIGGVEADYAINMSNGASVNLQSGQNFSTQKGSGGSVTTYTVVNDAAALQTVMEGSGSYALGSHLDLSGAAWRADRPNLRGKFDGLGHTLNNLSVTSASDYVGLFRTITSSADLRHIGLVNANISGSPDTSSFAGGLAGANLGSIRRAYVTGQISGSSNALLIGSVVAGGLVGTNQGSISDSYSTARVTVVNTVSGIPGSSYAGGLVGKNDDTGSIRRSYATGTVSVTGSGSIYAGGLVGSNMDSASIDQTYATGQVQTSKTGDIGGLVGSGSGSTVTNSFWDTQTTGQSSSAGGIGKTTDQMQQASTYTGWDFGKTWRISETLGETSEGYAFYGLPTLQGVTPKTDYQYFDFGYGTDANPWVLANWQQLQNINFNTATLSGYYRLDADLDKSSVGYGALASATANSGQGWKPLGDDSNAFQGSFDGQNHTIGDLTINRPAQDYVGLFGYAENATLRNVGVVDANVAGGNNVGGLVGNNTANNGNASISNAYATGEVVGSYFVGGLVGVNYATAGGTADIANAYASGAITGDEYVGGLVGVNKVEENSLGQATIHSAYAIGQVTSTRFVAGGLVGQNSVGSTITDAYALGQVQAITNVAGGLVGTNWGTIRRSYAAVAVAETEREKSYGAFAGNNLGSIEDSFWNTDVAGSLEGTTNGNLRGFTGKTTDDLQTLQTFADAGWDIDDTGGTGAVWRIYEGQSGPLLRSFLKQVTVTADASSITGKTYDGTAASGSASYTTDVTGAVLDGDSLGYSTTGKNAGSYSTENGTLVLGGLHSGQQGYDISYTDAALTIDRAGLTITANDTSKTQGNALVLDGGTGFTVGTGLAAGEVVDSVQLSSPGAPASAAAGQHAITASGAQGGNGFDAANYAITYLDGTLTVASAPVAPPAAGNLPSGGAIWHAEHQQLLADAPAFVALLGTPAAVGQPGSGVPHLVLEPDFIRVRERE